MGNEQVEVAISKSPAMDAEERKPLSRKTKLCYAAAIFYGNLAFGCAFNTYGPVATSMQNKYDTDDNSISRVFTNLTGGYMVGALSGGIIFTYINRQMAAIGLLVSMAAMMFLTPHCPSISLFFATAAVMGFTCGSYGPPYVQSQHFFYSLGTSVSSLIMAPYLDEEEDETTTTTMASRAYPAEYNISHDDLIFAGESTTKSDTDGEKLFIPYVIVGCMVLVALASQILLLIFMRYHEPPPEDREESSEVLKADPQKGEEETKTTENSLGRWSLEKLRLVIICCAFYGAYQGMEMCTFQFFPKFGQNSDLDLSESESTYVLSGITAAYEVGRAVAIFAVFKIPLQLILCGNILLIVIADVLLVADKLRKMFHTACKRSVIRTV